MPLTQKQELQLIERQTNQVKTVRELMEKEMSDTPETDAEAFIETTASNDLVTAKFARRLERQRDAVLSVLKDFIDAPSSDAELEAVKKAGNLISFIEGKP